MKQSGLPTKPNKENVQRIQIGRKMEARLGFSLLCLLLLFCSTTHALICQNAEGGEELSRSMFPRDFFFGASTSAYQIEGAFLEDGKGLSNWDVFTHQRGVVYNGDNGDFADDSYHRYMEDVELLQSLGVNAYRFSISWSRILPKGRFGKFNPEGIKFYNKIIDTLLLKGIEPFVTIFHYDIPQELEEKYGSLLSPEIQEDFVLFARTCFENFGDRVKHWATVNEPNMLAHSTYRLGDCPPSRCSPPFGNCSAGNSDVEPFVAVHSILLSHAKAVRLYREEFRPKQGGVVGLVLHSYWYEPYNDTESHREAVNRALLFDVAWILDPLVYGDYPDKMRQYMGSSLPNFTAEETALVKGSLDFIGINHYTTFYAIDCFQSPCSALANRPSLGFVDKTGFKEGIPIGERTGLPIFFMAPRGMEKIVEYLSTRYPNMPIYVTENGYATNSAKELDVNEILNDSKRIEFHKSYLAALSKAMRNGANVKGYFIWSLIDNFEWTFGYSMRFGLYYIDRKTLNRTPKLSAGWYADFIANKNYPHGRLNVLPSSWRKSLMFSCKSEGIDKY